MKAILTIGIPCSGKSTWAEEFCEKNSYREINRDNIRMRLHGLERYNDYVMNRKNEQLTTEYMNQEILDSAKNSQNIVISDTNLNEYYRVRLIQKLESLGYEVELKTFWIEYFDACRRNDRRKDKNIPRSVMYNMYRNFMEFQESRGNWEKYTPNKELPQAWIVDIDGTIADMKGIRNAYDWDSVHLDKPIHGVIELVQTLHESGLEIILLSGRDETSRELTESWLFENYITYSELHMRPKGSMEKDRYVKHRLFNDVSQRYWIKGAIDDRPQVSLLWYDLGLTLLKVNDPIREF